MPGIHHTAIVTADVERSRRFWCDGLGLAELMDYTFHGDWPTLFGATSDQLRSVFLGDPALPDSGIVELVVFSGAETGSAPPASPRCGFFLVSLQRDVEPTLATLADLGFSDGVRRISMPAPGGATVAMAVLTAPDGVLVELVGAPA
jgi:catechol 2,3-dioxygenase-like lactoylglutathione lyase family enzyme